MYLIQCEVCSKKYVGGTKPNLGKTSTCTNRGSDLTHANTTRDHSTEVNLSHKQTFSVNFFSGNHNDMFEIRVKMIDGGDNIFSL